MQTLETWEQSIIFAGIHYPSLIFSCSKSLGEGKASHCIMLTCIYACILGNCTVKKVKENEREGLLILRWEQYFLWTLLEKRVVLITEWNTRWTITFLLKHLWILICLSIWGPFFSFISFSTLYLLQHRIPVPWDIHYMLCSLRNFITCLFWCFK